VTWSETVGS